MVETSDVQIESLGYPTFIHISGNGGVDQVEDKKVDNKTRIFNVDIHLVVEGIHYCMGIVAGPINCRFDAGKTREYHTSLKTFGEGESNVMEDKGKFYLRLCTEGLAYVCQFARDKKLKPREREAWLIEKRPPPDVSRLDKRLRIESPPDGSHAIIYDDKEKYEKLVLGVLPPRNESYVLPRSSEPRRITLISGEVSITFPGNKGKTTTVELKNTMPTSDNPEIKIPLDKTVDIPAGKEVKITVRGGATAAYMCEYLYDGRVEGIRRNTREQARKENK